MSEFTRLLLSGRNLGLDCFRNVLADAGYDLLEVIDVEETQGFICRRSVATEPPYVVVAFRGTEKKVQDWLTDVDCKPEEYGVRKKVHRGFLKALTQKLDRSDRTVKDIVESVLASHETRDADGKPLPVFITGHSLGGALALIATVLLMPDVNGACYTYGAPRVANYEFFQNVKTPVYRVVNSADAVPRVPPGAGLLLLRGVIRGAAWITSWWPEVSRSLYKIEAAVDKLNGYRHYGDLRYLTDVAVGRFDQVRLLRNPPAIDRIVWMWRGIANSVWWPVKAHSMEIYRLKLAKIAQARRLRGEDSNQVRASLRGGTH